MIDVLALLICCDAAAFTDLSTLGVVIVVVELGDIDNGGVEAFATGDDTIIFVLVFDVDKLSCTKCSSFIVADFLYM